MGHWGSSEEVFIYKGRRTPERYNWQNAFTADNPPGYYGREGVTYFVVPGVEFGGGGETRTPRVVWQEGCFYIIRIPGGRSWMRIGDTMHVRAEYLLLELLKPHLADDRTPDIALRGDKWMLWATGRPERHWKRCVRRMQDKAQQELANRATRSK
jgi:hypothetical protein